MQTAADEVTEDAVPLCPGCFHVLENDPDFYPGCNAPIGVITLIDPLREAKAYAYLYRRGVEFPNRPLIFWGMTLTAGAYLAMGLLILAWGIADAASTDLSEAAGLILGALFYSSFGGVALYKVFRNASAPARPVDDPANPYDSK